MCELCEVEGKDMIDARVYGSSLPELRVRALDVALAFYGPAARLQVLAVHGVVGRSHHDERGTATANVLVQCLNPAEAEASMVQMYVDEAVAEIMEVCGEDSAGVRQETLRDGQGLPRERER